MVEKQPRIGIIGLGPIGSILTAHLAKDGADIIAEDIVKELLVKIQKEGIHISGFTSLNAQIKKTTTSISDLSTYDPEIIFITTKANILKNILPQIKKIYKPDMKIVCFQNGLGNEQLIANTLGIDTTYRVVINYAGNLVNYGNVIMNWFHPPNYIGAYHRGEYITDEITRKIAHMMTTTGLKTDETPNLKKYVWEKTILNSALCSICAVTGQTMKEAMEFIHTSNLAIKMLKEGLEVALTDGYDFGENALERFVSYLKKGGNHKPSMLIDIENKKPTEVDFMSGAITENGEKLGVPTPINSTFTNILKAVENQYQ